LLLFVKGGVYPNQNASLVGILLLKVWLLLMPQSVAIWARWQMQPRSWTLRLTSF